MKKTRFGLRTVAIAAAVATAVVTSGVASAASAPTPGVTPSRIRVGFIYPDFANLPAGFSLPDTGSPVDQAKAFVDDLNQRGGINGRTVELKTYKYGFTSADPLAEMRARCLKATEDDKVFAVITPSYFADPVLCVTRQHRTPMILGGGTTQEVIKKSEGRLFLTNFSTEHAIQASVDPLVKAKALKGKKLAVILEDTPGFGTAIKNGLEKPLAKHGLSIDDKVTIGATQEGITSLPAAVQRLKNEGVDGVFLAVNAIFSGLFMQAAVKADYKPQYYASDLSENSTDILPQTAPKAQMRGALGTTWRRTGSTTVGQPPSAYDTKCNATYAKHAGVAPAKPGSNVYGSIAGQCGLVDVLAQAATAAGKDLTVKSFTKALQGLKAFQLGNGGRGSFGPKKFDAPDEVRSLKYKPSCNCWVPTSAYHPVKF